MNFKLFSLLSCVLFFIACDEKEQPPHVDLSLPQVYINTVNSQAIDSKDYYVKGNVEVFNGDGEQESSYPMKIRGRGNSTWSFPKKPYQMNLEEKESFLGMAKDKKWIFLANYSDKTMLRNEFAFDLGRFSKMDWTPDSRFAEVYINSEYQGIYQITQKVETSPNRVDLGDYGFLVEVDQVERLGSEDVFFITDHYLINIKEPEVNFNDDGFNYISNYIKVAEQALMGDDFADPDKGYAQYFDVTSFVEWYLVNEITKNNDANFYSSVFMHLKPGGKLKMGPIWDFDISLGNINYNGNETTDGLWITNTVWMERLFQDPNFVAQVKERFNEFYRNKDQFLLTLMSKYQVLNTNHEQNFERWPILGIYVWPNNVYFDTYKEEYEYMIDWFNDRMDWMNTHLNSL